MTTEEVFNVVQFFVGGKYEYVLRFVSIDEAVLDAQCRIQVAKEWGDRSPIDRIIITDILDCTCFEWTLKDGIIFPNKQQLEEMTIKEVH